MEGARTGVSARRQRGTALLLVLMVAAVFLILMGSLVDVLMMESQDARASQASDAALTAAYSGVDELILKIEEFYQNSVQNGSFPTTASCNFTSPDGSQPPAGCNASVQQTWHGVGLNYYLIQSHGFVVTNAQSGPEVTRTVDALVREVPFGVYAQFTENDRSNTGRTVWYTSGQTFNGPVYSGGPMHIRYDSSVTQPIFPAGFTSVGLPTWFDVDDTAGNPNHAPNTTAEHQAVFGPSGSSNTINTGIPLPGFAQNLVVFSEAFYGDANHGNANDPGLASAPGVYLNGTTTPAGNLNTGIYVQGDAVVNAQATAGSGLNSGSETFTFSPPPGDRSGIPGTVVITLNFSTDTTTVQTSGGTVQLNGIPSGEAAGSNNGNGAIFDNGNLTVSDGSTIHGQYTMAVPDPPTSGQDITLQGSLKYIDQNLDQVPDELALWANDIWLKTTESNPTVDAMILTGYAGECPQGSGCRDGFFGNWNCRTSPTCAGAHGTLDMLGALIENYRGQMGALSPTGSPIGGYLKSFSYDARLGASPPPFTPTTNIYTIVALQDLGP